MNVIETIKGQMAESARVKQRMLEDDALVEKIEDIAGLIVDAYRSGNKTMVNKFTFDRPGLPALSLSTDTSIITAVGNDYGFERLFARQIEAQGRPGDVFIGISTSGKSRNLVEALAACKAKGIKSVAIVGSEACPMDDYDYVIHVPSRSTPRIQECQTLIGHVICYLVEQALFGA